MNEIIEYVCIYLMTNRKEYTSKVKVYDMIGY